MGIHGTLLTKILGQKQQTTAVTTDTDSPGHRSCSWVMGCCCKFLWLWVGSTDFA